MIFADIFSLACTNCKKKTFDINEIVMQLSTHERTWASSAERGAILTVRVSTVEWEGGGTLLEKKENNKNACNALF